MNESSQRTATHDAAQRPAENADYLLYGQVAEQVNACLDAGQEPDVEALIAPHPEMASQLREMVGALILLHRLAERGAKTGMSASSSERNPVEELAEEFLARYRRGERPALSEYTNRYPQWADKIRSLFPLLIDMEAARLAPEDSGVPVSADPKLERVGDYQVLREIGRGGMGIVYEAVQVSLGRHVALKVLPRHALLEPRHLQRFEGEAKAAARLHHTNIVPVYGVGEENGLHYYVMQFIQGHGLDEVLAELQRLRHPKQAAEANSETRDTPPKPAEAASAVEVAQSLLSGNLRDTPRAPGANASRSELSIHLPGQSADSSLSETGKPYWQSVARIGVQVAEALAYAHSQYILHRDIKPSNLLLDTQGTVWVTDLGLAKAADSEDLTHTGDVVGTLRYMAPERFAGRCDGRSDLYALGLTLYELLTLRPAFLEAQRNQLLHQVLHAEPPRPRKLDRHIPRDLETIVLKAMDKDPARRYATSTELEEDLRRFLADRPVQARPVGQLERLWRWSKRNPVVASLIAAVFVLLAAVAGVASVGYVREATERAEADRQRTAAQTQREEAERQRAAAEAAEENTRRQWYAVNLSLMQKAWDANDVAHLRALLAETQEYSDRGFEWYYWQRLCHLDLHTFIGHRAVVIAVSWSPDGKRLATASWDGTTKVWEAASGQELFTLKGHTGMVNTVSWSPDGKRLATGSGDHTAKVWDAADGRQLRTLMGHMHGVSWVSWSPDGKRLATGSADSTARVWDAADGRELLSFKRHTNWVESVSWSPDGKRLATGSWDGTAKVWDTADGQELLALNGHTAQVDSVSWSPDGKRLATGSWDGTAKVCDAADGRLLFVLKGHTVDVNSVSWSPDGKRLATGSGDGTAKIWDAAGGRELLTLKGHTNGFNSVSWSPDGKRLATGSRDGTAKVWDAAGSREFGILRGHNQIVLSMSWSSDGQRLATGSGDGTTKVWDAAADRELISFKGHTDWVSSVSWSPDDTRLATASEDGTTKVWAAADGRELLACKGRRVCWSPDGTRLATVSAHATATVWDAAAGRQLLALQGHASTITSVSWSPDSQWLATGSADGTAIMWDGASGRKRLTLEGHTSGVRFLSWSPDGERLATGSDDGTARVWNAADSRELLTLKGHTAVGVSSLSWSKDGKRLATGSDDGTTMVWDAASGQELLTLPGSTVSWSPDGKRVVTGSTDGTVKVWEAASAEAVQEWARQDRALRESLVRNALYGPPAQGFIQSWLLLLPLPFDPKTELSAQALDRQQHLGEAQLRPRLGERVPVNGREFVWQEHRSPQAILDFNAVLGRRTDWSVAYAVCYVESDRARDDVWLQVGSDDLAKVYLNGLEIYQCRAARSLSVLEAVGPGKLKLGTNVLVFKVVNEMSNWEGCVRLVDAAGRPAQGIRVKLTPEP